MSGVLHRKLPLGRHADAVAFDDEPTTATPRGRRAPADPAVDPADRDNRAVVEADEVTEDADTKILTWVRERHPRIQH